MDAQPIIGTARRLIGCSKNGRRGSFARKIRRTRLAEPVYAAFLCTIRMNQRSRRSGPGAVRPGGNLAATGEEDPARARELCARRLLSAPSVRFECLSLRSKLAPPERAPRWSFA